MKVSRPSAINIGRVKNNRIKTISGYVEHSSATDVHFKVNGNDIFYCDIWAYGSKGDWLYGDFGDDISLQLIESGKKKKTERE